MILLKNYYQTSCGFLFLDTVQVYSVT